MIKDWISRGVCMVASAAFPAWAASSASGVAGNLFANSGFESHATDGETWHLDRGGQTEAEFSVERADGAEGVRCARVRMGKVSEWGAQFGQQVAAGAKGKTYTLAVLAQAVGEAVEVDLQIERCAKPYDRAARGGPFKLMSGTWTELHVTFTVEKEFPQGWFAYVSCSQPNAEFRVDAFRLCEGPFVPLAQSAGGDAAGGDVGCKAVGDDALTVTNRLVEVRFRRGAAAVETRVRLGDAMVVGPRLVLRAGTGSGGVPVNGFRTTEQRPDRVRVDVLAASAAGPKVAATLTVRKDSPSIEVQPGDGAGGLRLEQRSRWGVVPDPFGGDLLVDPAKLRSDRVRLPGENLAVLTPEGGDLLVVLAWPSPAQRAHLSIGGAGAERTIEGAEVGFEGASAVTVALLAAPAIWQRIPMAALDAVKDTPFERPVPFRALWRADMRRADGLVDSWRAVIRRADGGWDGFGVSFTKPKTRTVWMSSRGTFAYPACVDGGRLLLRRSRFDGPSGWAYAAGGEAIAYPYQALDGNPPTVRGVFDVLQDALSGTPAEKRLDEWTVRRAPRDRFPATCAVTAEYEAAFEAGEEKAKKAQLIERLEAMNQFVIGIRGRIDEYLAWRTAMSGFLAQAKTADPRLAPLADEFAGVLAQFDRRFKELKLGEGTPTAAQALIAKVTALIDDPGADRTERAKQIGRETRTVGGNQDHAIGDFRMFSRELRQRAGLRMIEAQDEAAFDFAREVRARTLQVLGSAFGHEGAFTE